jgi:hypothetical protein
MVSCIFRGRDDGAELYAANCLAHRRVSRGLHVSIAIGPALDLFLTCQQHTLPSHHGIPACGAPGVHRPLRHHAAHHRTYRLSPTPPVLANCVGQGISASLLVARIGIEMTAGERPPLRMSAMPSLAFPDDNVFEHKLAGERKDVSFDGSAEIC